MSPKIATIFLSLLSLTLTLSSVAANNGCPGDTVADVLKHFDIPTGLFPNNVKDFSCEPVSNTGVDDAITLSIQLAGVCKVTKEFVMIKNVLECDDKISATVSYHQLSNVKGVTVKLSFSNVPIGEVMTISGVTITTDGFWGFKAIQFSSKEGFKSPVFPVFIIPSKPATCDAVAAHGRVAAANKYGPLLLPFDA